MSENQPPPPPKQLRVYQPTYQLNPRVPFNEESVKKSLKRIMDGELDEAEYNEKLIPEMCLNLTEMIRNCIKEKQYDRYRIIVCVSIGQKRQQSVYVCHGFLWDDERDRSVSYSLDLPQLFAVATVYAIYLD